MSESRPPVEPPPDALEAAYRRASAADAGSPSEAVRERILAHARTVAAARKPAAKFPADRPAANEPYRWRAIAASLAVAAIALALWVPRERREAALAPPAARQVAGEVAPQTAAGGPGAAREAPLARDASSRAHDAYVPEPPPRARTEAMQKKAPPRAAPNEAPAVGQAAAPAAAPAAAEPAAAPAIEGPAAKAAAPAASAGAPAPATAVPSSAPAAAGRAVEDVVVTGARRASQPGATLGTPTTLADLSARQNEAKLQAAINAGDAQGVRALVPRRLALESRDARGRTPLMQAVIAGQADVVRYLIEAGADVNATDADGATPLARATAAGRNDLVSQLAAAGAR